MCVEYDDPRIMCRCVTTKRAVLVFQNQVRPHLFTSFLIHFCGFCCNSITGFWKSWQCKAALENLQRQSIITMFTIIFWNDKSRPQCKATVIIHSPRPYYKVYERMNMTGKRRRLFVKGERVFYLHLILSYTWFITHVPFLELLVRPIGWMIDALCTCKVMG